MGSSQAGYEHLYREVSAERDRLIEQYESATHREVVLKDVISELTAERDWLVEQLETLRTAVENYIAADASYTRRIDTSSLRDALESTEMTPWSRPK